MKPKFTKYWFVIYVLAALLILGGLLNLGIHFGPKVEAWLVIQLVPEVWRSTIDDLIHRLFLKEFRAFIVTTGFGLGIVIIGMTLFPIKEKLSATYEEERFPDLKKHDPPPMWRQGLEEIKLAFLYIHLQGMSLFLAVQGHAILASLGTALSVAYLIAAMTLDHCSPFFQRRDRKIHGIIWLLLRHAPLRAFLIGFTCIGPVILLERGLPSSLDTTLTISILVFTEVIGMAVATLLGCHLGAALVKKDPSLTESRPPTLWTLIYRGCVLTLTVWLGIFFSWWGYGVYTHYHFIRCRYHPLWNDADFKVRETKLTITLPVEVDNRSTGAIDPTELKIEVQGKGILEGGVGLLGPQIRAGETSQIQLNFEAELSEEALLDLPRFLETEYSAHLKFEPPFSQPVLLRIFPQ